MLVSDLIAAMHAIAPLDLAEAWDNVGLLIGDASRPLAGPVLLTIDLTDAVLDEAIAMQAGAIVAYHPPIFSPMKRITGDSWAGALRLRVIEHTIAVYSPHTALDAAPGGVTDWLIDQACLTEPDAPARGSALRAIASLAGASGSVGDGSQTHKIVTFVPREAVEHVRDAMAAAGAGVIGNYERCSFAVEGTGTFCAGADANPAIGGRGRVESVGELRLEMVCGERALPAAVAALRAVHPYEEPAFDVYALVPRPRAGAGAGRIVTLAEAADLESVARRLKSRLGLQVVSVAQRGARQITRIAAVPGSGASLLDAAIAVGAECFITGEMKHHEVLSALERGCSVILAGHTETERGYLPVLTSRLNAMRSGFRATVSRADCAPLRAV